MADQVLTGVLHSEKISAKKFSNAKTVGYRKFYSAKKFAAQ